LAKPAPEYELILMLDPEVPDERRDAISAEARKRIEAGTTLKQERSWGLRQMAYEIDRRIEADYRFFRFEQGAAVLDDLSHNLRITDGVLRFRIFKVDPSAPVTDPPPPINLAATASPRPGARGGRYEDRPPRGPDQASGDAPPTAEAPAPVEAATADPVAAEAEPPAPAEPAAETASDAAETASEVPAEPETAAAAPADEAGSASDGDAA